MNYEKDPHHQECKNSTSMPTQIINKCLCPCFKNRYCQTNCIESHINLHKDLLTDTTESASSVSYLDILIDWTLMQPNNTTL